VDRAPQIVPVQEKRPVQAWLIVAPDKQADNLRSPRAIVLANDQAAPVEGHPVANLDLVRQITRNIVPNIRSRAS
jgi:hypothetical protein